MKKILLASIFIGSFAFAQVKGDIQVPDMNYKLKPGKGVETVQANCLMCHTFGYMLNQGKQSKKFWRGKVNKMVNAFKAPIAKKDQDIIVNYLATQYGNGK